MNVNSKPKAHAWQQMKRLRKVEQNFSGWSYSYDWAKNYNLLENRIGESWGNIHTVYTPEPIEIRQNASGDIECRIVDCQDCEYVTDFDTKFGRFHSDNNGEFGGELILPSGNIIGGNFSLVFDFDNKVYAIDSMRHMCLGHFKLYEFFDSDSQHCIYDVGGFGRHSKESLDFQGIFIEKNELYILIGGEILLNGKDAKKYGDTYKCLSRLLMVTNGKVKECLEIEEAFDSVQNIIIANNHLHVAADKLLAVIDIVNGDKEYYTFIGEEAEHNLLSTHENFVYE